MDPVVLRRCYLDAANTIVAELEFVRSPVASGTVAEAITAASGALGMEGGVAVAGKGAEGIDGRQATWVVLRTKSGAHDVLELVFLLPDREQFYVVTTTIMSEWFERLRVPALQAIRSISYERAADAAAAPDTTALLQAARGGELEAAARLVGVGAHEALAELAATPAATEWSRAAATASGLAAAHIAGACHVERALVAASDDAKGHGERAMALLGDGDSLDPLLQARLALLLQARGQADAAQRLASRATGSLLGTAARDPRADHTRKLEAGRLLLQDVVRQRKQMEGLQVLDKVRSAAREACDTELRVRVLACLVAQAPGAVSPLAAYHADAAEELASLHAQRRHTAEVVACRELAAANYERNGDWRRAIHLRLSAVDAARANPQPSTLGTALEPLARVLAPDDSLTPAAAGGVAPLWQEAAAQWRAAGNRARAAWATLEEAGMRAKQQPPETEPARALLRAAQAELQAEPDPARAAFATLVASWIEGNGTDVGPKRWSLLEQATIVARQANSPAVLGRVLLDRTRVLLLRALPQSKPVLQDLDLDLSEMRECARQAAEQLAAAGDRWRRAEALELLALTMHPSADPKASWEGAYQAYRTAADGYLQIGRRAKCAEVALVGLLCKGQGDWLRVSSSDLTLLNKFATYAQEGGDPELARSMRELYRDLGLQRLSPGRRSIGSPQGQGARPCGFCGGIGHLPAGVFGPHPVPCLQCGGTGRAR